MRFLVSLAALAAAASTTNKLLKSIEAGVSVDDLDEIIADTDIDEADDRGVTLLWASAFYGRVDVVDDRRLRLRELLLGQHALGFEIRQFFDLRRE